MLKKNLIQDLAKLHHGVRCEQEILNSCNVISPFTNLPADSLIHPVIHNASFLWSYYAN